MSSREFEHNFPEYEGQELLGPDQENINAAFSGKLRQNIESLLRRLEDGLSKGVDWNDHSVYTGTTGIAYLHFHLYKNLDGSQDHLRRALTYIEPALKSLRRRRLTFLCGDAGPLALGAVVYSELGQQEERRDCLKRLVSRHSTVLEDATLPDELLFGRVGYLFSLLFVNHHLGPETVDKAIIHKVYETVLKSGRQTSREERSKFPLMYEWHDKKYLGAAHGLVGIFYVLMQVEDPAYSKYLNEWIRPCIEMLMSLRYPSGNYPSSIGSQSGDKLVHWCHGSPGWVHLFALAYKTYGEQKYLDEAVVCGEVIWRRGLLRKGYSLCHGTAGNAYAFLCLYKLTQDARHLHRACKFAEWCFDYGKHGCRTPDRPLSLFEGLAGTIYFLVDLLKPKQAKFPAFEL